MKELFKLSLITIVHQKLVFLVLCLIVVVPFVSAQFTSAGIEEDLVAVARVQALWQLCWFSLILWLLYQAAYLSSWNVQSGMGAYWKSRGLGESVQMTVLWSVVMSVAVMLVLSATVLSIFVAPSGEGEIYRHWVILSLQQLVMMLLIVSGWVFVVLAIAGRFGQVIGYLSGLFVAFSGFYVVVLIGKVADFRDAPLFDLLYIVMPHAYLGDLTHRFIHYQGAMSSLEFFQVFEYLAGWTLMMAIVAIPLAKVVKR